MSLNLNVDFMDMAACRGEDPALFYPERYESTTEAKAMCASCPVRIDCLEYALSLPISDDHGIWGGLSERERDRIRSQRGGLAPCGTSAAYERHRRRGDPTCEPCLTAKRLENARNRANRRAS